MGALGSPWQLSVSLFPRQSFFLSASLFPPHSFLPVSLLFLLFPLLSVLGTPSSHKTLTLSGCLRRLMKDVLIPTPHLPWHLLLHRLLTISTYSFSHIYAHLGVLKTNYMQLSVQNKTGHRRRRQRRHRFLLLICFLGSPGPCTEGCTGRRRARARAQPLKVEIERREVIERKEKKRSVPQ